jgi:hypothetical protein
MKTEAYIQIEYDMAGDPIPYYDEEGKPVTHPTREEAQAEADSDTRECQQQVEDGERTEDEVPEPDEVHPCTVDEDGTVTLVDGTIIPTREP